VHGYIERLRCDRDNVLLYEDFVGTAEQISKVIEVAVSPSDLTTFAIDGHPQMGGA
jgi:hypothetical protein